jgi:hypothetical protein
VNRAKNGSLSVHPLSRCRRKSSGGSGCRNNGAGDTVNPSED